jgi:uncharacterized protein DUF6448
MFIKKAYLILLTATVIFSVIFLYNEILKAHCDTLDGPVVNACKKSLETGNINYTLIWVQQQDEGIIRESFDKTLEVRALSPKAKDLADMNFFETVVRIHRSSEGAAYDGLKPAGSVIDPSIVAGDKAIETGTMKDVEKLVFDALHKKMESHFNEVLEKKNFDPNDVRAGREYVKSYVDYIHFVESIYKSSSENSEIHHMEH